MGRSKNHKSKNADCQAASRLVKRVAIAIAHIPVPKFSGSERRRYAPRPDLVLDVVIEKTPNTVNALRLVRARVPIEKPT